ncbi:hypothetical protein K788_0008320 [Paraburkholderia caribensis MBA4]|uniref:Uncharacterized protein n=1 Tax=Paraburkholderia caribensis MBA4 TaxID=1323664 RepID=A0A0P0REN8_9BURK|nr:hypothetical protein [Paraburkholderia caribensis]ALL67033.1 hypothetical protein K788_0008320 [Paraburkholderia caribensis MBA4]
MNEGKKNALEQAHSISRIESTIGDVGRVTGLARKMRLRAMALVAVSAGLYLHASASVAQDASMLDERVSQRNIATTICRPGYADTVSPPFDDMMELKDRLLAERGIDAGHGARYALDRRVPILLGGSPDAQDNLDLLPWGGHKGERRKALLTAKLKRCVCEGRMSLGEAQAAIAGNWPAHYAGFGSAPCGDDSGVASIGGDGS